MKDELEKNQEDLFFKSSTEVDGGKGESEDDYDNGYQESPSFSHQYSQGTNAFQDRSDMRFRPSGGENVELADLKKRTAEVAAELGQREQTGGIPRVEPYIEGEN